MTSTRFRALRMLAAGGIVAIAVTACGTAGTGSASAPASASASPSDVASPSASAPSPSASAASPSASVGASVTITGTEYRYDGVPASPTVGTELAFTNGGTEAHEMVVVRRNADVTMSFQELFALPQEEALAMVALLGNVIANPGETGEGTVVLDQPGTYALVCFIPVGMTEFPESLDPNASLPTGAPHFTQGMFAEFTVAG